MGIKLIIKHNQNIKKAIDIINDTYEKIYYNDLTLLTIKRVNSYKIKNFGLINSLKGIFMPKQYFIKGYNAIVKEYNLILNRDQILDIIKKGNNEKIEEIKKDIVKSKKKMEKLEETLKDFVKDENYLKCEKLCKKLKKAAEELDATKTEETEETEKKRVPRNRVKLIYIGGKYFPRIVTEYVTESKTEKHSKKVPDEEIREKAKAKIKEIESELITIPNYEENVKIFGMFQEAKYLKSKVKELKDEKNTLEYENARNIIYKHNSTIGLEKLKQCIDTEKEILESKYPGISKTNALEPIKQTQLEDYLNLE